MSELIPPPPPPDDADAPPAPPAKRVKTDGGNGDQLSAALQKIRSHISSPKKFVKASGLLRQLLQGGSLNRIQHGPLVFAALCAAMEDTKRADDLALRKEYHKLFTAASKCKELFSSEQLTQLATDDSFVFNRVLGHIKAAVAALPEAFEEHDAVLKEMQARIGPAGSTVEAAPQAAASGAAASSADSVSATAASSDDKAAPQEPAAQQAAAAETDDPFGIESLIGQDRQQEAWSTEEALAMKRAALLDCFDSMIAACVNAWAHLSTEIAIEELVKNRQRFCSAQQERITALQHFAKQQRITRQRGPSAKEKRRDTTTFEAARKTWGIAKVSARGTIMKGDHKSEQWLG